MIEHLLFITGRIIYSEPLSEFFRLIIYLIQTLRWSVVMTIAFLTAHRAVYNFCAVFKFVKPLILDEKIDDFLSHK
jgi:hypothetical protein